jgi:hypothetical protein
VRAAAARAVGAARPAALAAQILAGIAASERDPEPLAGALEALARLGAPIALHRARLAIDEAEHPPAPFVRIVGVAGGPEDVARLAGVAQWPSTLLALGWLGAPEAVELLIAALRLEADGRDDARPISERALAAGLALQRITGGVARGDGSVTLGALKTSDRARIETRPAAWREYAGALSFEGRKKSRWGRAWSPELSLDELEAAGASPSDRALAQLEIGVRAPPRAAALRDPMDRATLQRAAIALARAT